MSGKAVRETLGFLAVVAGLVFVGFEIQQNSEATQAETRQILLQGFLSIIGPGATGDNSSNDISSNPRRKSQ